MGGMAFLFRNSPDTAVVCSRRTGLGPFLDKKSPAPIVITVEFHKGIETMRVKLLFYVKNVYYSLSKYAVSSSSRSLMFSTNGSMSLVPSISINLITN
jgi:hypothetical protein